MRYGILDRTYLEKCTLGTLSIYLDGRDAFDNVQSPLVRLATLELPWKDNQRNISCIPEGTYMCVPRSSVKHGAHFHLVNVPQRSLILIHVANYISQLQGCIAPGMQHSDINKDGIMDVASSGAAMNIIRRMCWHSGLMLRVQREPIKLTI